MNSLREQKRSADYTDREMTVHGEVHKHRMGVSTAAGYLHSLEEDSARHRAYIVRPVDMRDLASMIRVEGEDEDQDVTWQFPLQT